MWLNPNKCKGNPAVLWLFGRAMFFCRAVETSVVGQVTQAAKFSPAIFARILCLDRAFVGLMLTCCTMMAGIGSQVGQVAELSSAATAKIFGGFRPFEQLMLAGSAVKATVSYQVTDA
ncbi:MAG: hypothetical protein EOP50_05625 [Sphingobacteriales bacterium]|nr:MAG: hypothetical protein EOP50_05625 [Sphingobacteriales bacterium]